MSAESDNEVYEVEAVVGRRTKAGRMQYLLKWKGYDERTWTDVKECESCTEKIEDFEKSLLQPDTTIRISSPPPEQSPTKNADKAGSEDNSGRMAGLPPHRPPKSAQQSTSRKAKRARSPSSEGDIDDDEDRKKGRRSSRLSKSSQQTSTRKSRSTRAQGSASPEVDNDLTSTPLNASTTNSSDGSNQPLPTRQARAALSSSEERDDGPPEMTEEDIAHANFVATFGAALGIPPPAGSATTSPSKRTEREQSPDSDASSIAVVSVRRRPRVSGGDMTNPVTIDSSDSEMNVKPVLSRTSTSRKSNGRVGRSELKSLVLRRPSPPMNRRSNRLQRASESDDESDVAIVATPSRKRPTVSMSSIVFGRKVVSSNGSEEPSSDLQRSEVGRPSAKRSRMNEQTPDVVTVDDDDDEMMQLIEMRKRRPSINIQRHSQRVIDIADESDQEELIKRTTSVALLAPVIPPSIRSSGISPLDQMLTTMILSDPFVLPVEEPTTVDKDKKNKNRPEPIERKEDWASLNILRLEDLPGFIVWSAEAYLDEGHVFPDPLLQNNGVERFLDRDVERIVGFVPGGPVPFFIVKLALKDGETSANVQEVVVGVEQQKLAFRVFPEAVSEYINRCARVRTR